MTVYRYSDLLMFLKNNQIPCTEIYNLWFPQTFSHFSGWKLMLFNMSLVTYNEWYSTNLIQNQQKLSNT